MAYDPHDVVSKCDDEDAVYMERLEVNFGIPVLMTQDQQHRLYLIISEIVQSPWNQPKEGVHWLAGSGSKPKWSKADCRLLGIRPDDDAKEFGEPDFDDSVYFMETCALEFVSEKERKRTEATRRRRAAEREKRSGQ